MCVKAAHMSDHISTRSFAFLKANTHSFDISKRNPPPQGNSNKNIESAFSFETTYPQGHSVPILGKPTAHVVFPAEK
nr:hypothetical transcript [Hymenolepis microstoma]